MRPTATDPYYVVKDEVQDAITKLQAMHEDWQRLLRSENTATHSRFQELHSEIAAELRQLDYDLQDITETVKAVEGNRAHFSIDDAEVQSRKDFVQTSRDTVRSIQESVTSRESLGKIDTDRRQALGTSRLDAAPDETPSSALAHRESEAFLERQRQEQQQIVAQQDQDLNLFSQSAKRLRETAKVINVELQDQQKMLEELDDDIDREVEKLNFVLKRVGKLLKTSNRGQLLLVVGLSALLMVLMFLVINT